MVDKKPNSAPVEAPLTEQTKKYVVIKNHVRELLPEKETLRSVVAENEISEKSRKIMKPSRKRKRESPETLPTEPEATVICKDDLEELKTVYKRCKAVVRKIESKYGHLLGLDEEEYIRNDTRNQNDVCNCKNKKIVFDENGHMKEKPCTLDNHISSERINKYNSLNKESPVQVEYDNISDYLPNNLVDLENILKDSSIDRYYRNLVINKIYVIRQNHHNQMQYERNSLIEILKANPDELLAFKGTNVSTLPGYPTKPIDKQPNSE